MTAARSFVHNAAIYSLTNIINAAIPFFLLPILTRVLSPDGYGVISMYNATLGMSAPSPG